MSASPESQDRARSSCFHCRSSKRRCDKTLPSCQLCRRKSVECRYPRRRGQTSASPDQSPSNPDDTAAAITNSVPSLSHQAGSELPAEQITTTAIRFLAPDLFRDLRLQVSQLEGGIPDDVAFHLGNRQQMQKTTIAFLKLTRSWMPIVSGKRHLAAVLNPLLVSVRRTTALLALSMKLCCLSTDDKTDAHERHTLYLLAKSFYAEVERTEDTCIQVMQAGILIAVFEIGDAIYPAAYLTVGALARYAMAMGLNKINQDALGQNAEATAGASWVDIEEMRRVWWGTLILDRLLNFSQPSRSLSTANPSFEDFLPVDDECFHNQSSKSEDATRISTGFNFKTGSYARLCQASYLISKALALCQLTSVGIEEVVQLCRTFEALVRVNELEVTARKLAFCSQSSVAYIGIFLLQQHVWQYMDPGTEIQVLPDTHSALNSIDRISKTLKYGGNNTWRNLESENCTPFFVIAVYQALLVLMKIRQWRPVTEVQDKQESIMWLLLQMRKRWPLASVYERILETREIMLAAEVAST